jgi:YD repeat-containing protein
LTDEILSNAYAGTDCASYFLKFKTSMPSGDELISEYPTEFLNSIPKKLGYTYRKTENRSTTGYYTTLDQRKYDFQDEKPRTKMGLIVSKKDPLGNETTIEYDEYGLVPCKIIDHLKMTTTLTYDYYSLNPTSMVDTNGNRTLYKFNEFGLLSSITMRGGSEVEGDSEDDPTIRYQYDFNSFMLRRSPISVTTISKVNHGSNKTTRLAKVRNS